MKINVLSFQVIHFKSVDPISKQPTDPILIYALGEDGVVYEFAGGWFPLPIDTDNLRIPQPPRQSPPPLETEEKKSGTPHTRGRFNKL
jgi:hypothetical protein